MRLSAWIGFSLALTSLAFGKDPLHLVVAADKVASSTLSCKFQAEPTLKNATVRFKVSVAGSLAKIRWRLPLYKGSNGVNDVAIARIGRSVLDQEGAFFIDVGIEDLLRDPSLESYTIQVRTTRGGETECSTAAEPIRELAKAAPADLGAVNGAVTR